ncbi:MAG: hypothetical protein ACKOUT_08690 [Novosphingobium sp.]
MAADTESGDWTGLPLPTTVGELAALGPEWLTRAFQAFGAARHGEAVSDVARCEAAAGGNSGQKAILDIAWAVPSSDLATQLFVKLSRDFTDAFRDRRRGELEAEVRLARLSRHSGFPVPVARAWFADFHEASGTGLLITSRVPFGVGAVLPLRRKCRDHELSDPARYYRATMRALARLAAADQSGALAPAIDELFPYDPAAAAADMAFDWPPERLAEVLSNLKALLQRAPQLFPAEITASPFIDRFCCDIASAIHHEARLRAFLHADPRLIALAHWNTNLDNAWFEEEPDGELTAGLLDWGMVRRMNVGYGIWGGLSAAEPAMLREEMDALLALFAAEMAANGGAYISAQAIGDHFDLSLALLAAALLLEAPALLLERAPGLPRYSGPHDPALESDGVVEGFLKVFTNMLVLWHCRRIGDTLERLLGD